MKLLPIALVAVMAYTVVVADMHVAPANSPMQTDVKVTPAEPSKPMTVDVKAMPKAAEPVKVDDKAVKPIDLKPTMKPVDQPVKVEVKKVETPTTVEVKKVETPTTVEVKKVPDAAVKPVDKPVVK